MAEGRRSGEFLVSPDVAPRGLTEAELRERYGDDTDRILAHRRFLQVLDSAPTVQGGFKKVGELWFAYAKGEISAAEALRRDAAG